jgi:hypothetical protein
MPKLRALSSFHAGGRFVATDEEVDSKDPIVKGREALFTAESGQVEQATAAPGEKRTVRKRTAKKS